MSLLIGPHVNDPTLVATFSKNENNAAAMRIRCVCGKFLGSLGQFNPLDGVWKGHRFIKCEELKVLSVADTVKFLRQIGGDPNNAEKKGCGRFLIFNAQGQAVRITVPGTEEHTKLAAAIDALRLQKDNEARRIAFVKRAEEIQGAAYPPKSGVRLR
jgi:hypothetical protein